MWGATRYVWLRSAYRYTFQSTLPVWGATGRGVGQADGVQISIHAPRVGSDAVQRLAGQVYEISIHAPRVGSDTSSVFSPRFPTDFNPRSPCGERPLPSKWWTTSHAFQSTLPVWGATTDTTRRSLSITFQSTLPVWGATPEPVDVGLLAKFQSTLPVWGATGVQEAIDRLEA